MRIIEYDSLTSTNNEAGRLAETLAHGDVIVAREQTAGRGQRGNSWESAPGMNLTFSLFLRPEWPAADSFLLSMAISVGITEALREILHTDEIKIKWPNDIYWRDKKLVGILIENSFSGSMVSHSIAGIGLNVNQLVFTSDAPNPISMASIAGHEFITADVLRHVCTRILEQVKPENLNDEILLPRYHELLWRYGGTHFWREASGEVFEAAILQVAPTGHLTLADSDGVRHTYAFKEVFPVL